MLLVYYFSRSHHSLTHTTAPSFTFPPPFHHPCLGGNDGENSGIRDPLALAPRDYEDFEEGTTRLFLLKSLVQDTRAHVVERMVLDKGGNGQAVELLAGRGRERDL